MARSSSDLLAGILGSAPATPVVVPAPGPVQGPVPREGQPGRRRSSDITYERTTVNLPVGLRQEMREWAAAHGTSVSAMVTEAVRDRMRAGD